MTALKVSMSYARKAYDALSDNRNLNGYLEFLTSNVYELHPEEDGFMDEEQLEAELSDCLISAGVPEDEFWFD